MMKYIDGTDEFHLRADSPAGQALIGKMKADVELWSGIFQDDPRVDSGWGHHYFCSEDGAALTFDPERPGKHRCPVCGRVFARGAYDAAWVYQYRFQALTSALEAACLFRLRPDGKYLDHFERIIGFYSDHYEEFKVHGKGPTTSGNGKIMPQALNEAIFLCKSVNGLEMLKDSLSGEFLRSVGKKLLIPGARFIDAQKKIIHNIPCWINAGVGTVGLFTGCGELISRAFDEPLGLCDQVRRGVTSDHFWYEGSIHYNFFTVESFMNLMLFARLYEKQIPEDVEKSVFEMLLAPCRYAFSNGILPNPNDGWPDVNLKTYTYLYETAAKIFNSSRLRGVLSYIYTLPVSRTQLPLSSPVYEGDYSMEWLLFSAPGRAGGKDVFSGSHNFARSNFAILRRGPVEAFMKYGHCSPSHAHADKMNVEIMAFGESVSRDISNCGYAAPLCNGFYRTSVAHNTVLIDGRSHPTTSPGVTELWDGEQPLLCAGNPDAYEGVAFRRTLRLGPGTMEDFFEVSCGRAHVIDWLFHVEGECTGCPDTMAGDLRYTSNGYQYLSDIRRFPQADQIVLEWRFPHGVTGRQILATAGLEAYLCTSYDNPVSRTRRTVLLRAGGKSARFSQKWEFAQTGKGDGHNDGKAISAGSAGV